MTTQQVNPVAPGSQQPEDERAMSLIEHLVELRTRMMRASIGVIIGMAIGMFLVLGPPQIIDIIIRTFANTNQAFPPVQAVATFEQFSSYMTVALTVGVILGMPVIVYQLLAFIVPGLTDRERRVLFTALPFVMFFFIGGLAFGWFITVPVAIRFLVDFSSSELIQAQPTISDFLGKITMLLLINGIVFELPVIIFVLAFLGVVTAAQLRKYRRFAIVAVVIIAALITPTGDPINLALLAVPMYLLYEVGVFMARFAPKRT
ncbi:MAG: twin-arginine translocase subunit TatC [Oscillochloris sp.]|nr:twin-arginine translocase subunit TatC [Oscillochloris sp.]